MPLKLSYHLPQDVVEMHILSSQSEGEPRVYTSNKFSKDADASGARTTLQVAKL